MWAMFPIIRIPLNMTILRESLSCVQGKWPQKSSLLLAYVNPVLLFQAYLACYREILAYPVVSRPFLREVAQTEFGVSHRHLAKGLGQDQRILCKAVGRGPILFLKACLGVSSPFKERQFKGTL